MKSMYKNIVERLNNKKAELSERQDQFLCGIMKDILVALREMQLMICSLCNS